MEVEAAVSNCKEPLVVHVSRKEIFKAAAEQLSLTVKKEIIMPIQPNDFSAVIKVIRLKTPELNGSEPTKFYGDFSSTANEAVDSAYNEALKFLARQGLVIINDFNYDSLKRTKSHLAESETYLMFSQDSEHMLENELDFKVQGYKRLDPILKTICKEASTILPLSITKHKNPQTAHEFDMVTFTGDTSSADPMNKIALSLIEMDQIIDVHGYEIVHGDHSAMKEYWNRAAQRIDE